MFRLWGQNRKSTDGDCVGASRCPEKLQLSCQAGIRPPARGAGNPGCQYRRLCPGTAPWGPCGPGQSWLTSLVQLCCCLKKHLKKKNQNKYLEFKSTAVRSFSFDLWLSIKWTLTFSKRRDLYRQADDPHQILYLDQRPENGSDPQSFTFSCLDQLHRQRGHSHNSSVTFYIFIFRFYFDLTSYVHLRSTAPQQVDQGGVERHDGVSQVNPVLLMLLLSSKPVKTHIQ